jgi:hypothetical protein
MVEGHAAVAATTPVDAQMRARPRVRPRPLADALVSLVLMENCSAWSGSKTPPGVGGASGLREDGDQARDTTTCLTSAM